ncbi:hypothetical protein ACFP67_14115 [Mammaliicoccus sciuri]|uniref:hypothetical protein n=1 Tax=Mammaliicoccus sciuri TaxID=1296 RepID=UPI000CD1B9AF|nr:hypothetical protein [Mammaliicoccus sciuri]PNZ29998.1 hypothetical protein CD114_01205 [Mammaliicoccus sciuri]
MNDIYIIMYSIYLKDKLIDSYPLKRYFLSKKKAIEFLCISGYVHLADNVFSKENDKKYAEIITLYF